jgi:hypothetical protein
MPLAAFTPGTPDIAVTHGNLPRSLVKSSVMYVPGSTREICALTGQGETQTASGFGLKAADHGYPFYFQGKLWFLFGDAQPTKTFPPPPARHGQPNQNRWSHDPTSLVNDAIGYASSTGAAGCSQLAFARQTTPAVGAYRNPSVTYHGRSISLRTNESPNAGIGVSMHGKSQMYVIFSTNTPTAAHTSKTCKGKPTGCLGYPYSSVMAVLSNAGTMHFSGLYILSGPPPGSPPYSAPGKFVNVVIAPALSGGYLYF